MGSIIAGKHSAFTEVEWSNAADWEKEMGRQLRYWAASSSRAARGSGGCGQLHTKTGLTHTLGAVTPGAGAVVAPPRILTDLIVSAQVSAIATLINVCKENMEHFSNTVDPRTYERNPRELWICNVV